MQTLGRCVSLNKSFPSFSLLPSSIGGVERTLCSFRPRANCSTAAATVGGSVFRSLTTNSTPLVFDSFSRCAAPCSRRSFHSLKTDCLGSKNSSFAQKRSLSGLDAGILRSAPVLQAAPTLDSSRLNPVFDSNDTNSGFHVNIRRAFSLWRSHGVKNGGATGTVEFSRYS